MPDLTHQPQTALGLPTPQARYDTLQWLLNFKSRHTRKAYQTALEQFARFIADRRDGMGLFDVQPLHIIAWRDWMIDERQYANATVNAKLAAVWSFFEHMKNKGYGDYNPADEVQRQKVNPYGKATFLTPDEAATLLQQPDRSTLQGRRDFAMLLLFLSTGVRLAAVTGARVGDIQREGAHIVLRYINKGGAEDSARITSIYPALVYYLQARDVQPGVTDAPLFTATAAGIATSEQTGHGNPADQPLSGTSIRRLVDKYARMAGYEGITPHSLRHSAALKAIQSGSFADVSKLLRHADNRVTAVYLEHLDDSAGDKLADALGQDWLDDINRRD